MSDLSSIHTAIAAGLMPLRVLPPTLHSVWARDHFYLSAESSYVEQRWTPWPFQPFLMDCIGSDQVENFYLVKSARVGYTKILLSSLAYFAIKRRNQIVFQPTDDDSDEFVKTEFDPMVRDVAVMSDVFPTHMARHKDNTLRQKKMLGCMIHFRGGKAAKNYRRLSADVVNVDEISQFDNNIEGQGAPDRLAAKRLEGATFPKFNVGSTPGVEDMCHISRLVESAPHIFTPHIPCPHCGEFHALTMGGKDEPHGFKWQTYTHETTGETRLRVTHLCPHCAAHYTQQEYFTVWDRTEWRSNTGLRCTADFHFEKIDTGERVATPTTIGARGLWTAYSPQATWEQIAEEYINAARKLKSGNDALMRAFVNTTEGRAYKIETTQADAHALAVRAERYDLRVVPMGALRLTAGVDVQDNRFHINVYAWGRNEECWLIDRHILDADPGVESAWSALASYLFDTTFRHTSGTSLRIEAISIDSGGHFTHHVYAFARAYKDRRVYAIKGDHVPNKPVKSKASVMDINAKGKLIKKGVKLYFVGTDTAKDLLYARLQLREHGAGYIHFPQFDELNDYLAQLTVERRVPRRTSRGEVWGWECPAGRRNEDTDCYVYALHAAHMLDLHKLSDAQWTRIEDAVQPPNGSLFAEDAANVPTAQIATTNALTPHGKISLAQWGRQ